VGRQLIHIGFGLLFMVPLHLLGPIKFCLFLLAILIPGLAVSACVRRGIYVPLITELVETFERPEEMELPGQGTLHFLTGVLVATAIARQVQIVDVAIIVLAVGDGVSTIVGVPFGRTPLPHNPDKSLEGSLAGFVSAAALASIWTRDPAASVLASLVGTAVETLPALNDNVTIPIAVSLFLLWWWS